MTNWWLHYWRDTPPSALTFLLFSASWTLLTLAYVVAAPLRFPAAAPRLVLLGADGLAMTFWFAAFVALAVFLAARICSGNVCNVARASVALAQLSDAAHCSEAVERCLAAQWCWGHLEALRRC